MGGSLGGFRRLALGYGKPGIRGKGVTRDMFGGNYLSNDYLSDTASFVLCV